MSLKVDFSNVIETNIGQQHGLSLTEIEQLVPAAQSALAELRQKAEEGRVGFYKLPKQQETIEEIKTYAQAVRNRFEYYVHIGIGGSALGPIALQTSLLDSYYNLAQTPKLFFPDNVDPDWLHDLAEHIDPAKTLFHVVSKSGGTAETAATMLYFMDHLKASLGDDFYRNLLFTTDPVEGLLNQIARKYPIKCFRIPPGVGGRFSVLSPVGLISAAIAGIDIDELLQGAAEMAESCDRDNLMQNPAFIFAAVHFLYMRRGKNISVMMPYSNKLRDWADWYRQLWAESLGKRFNRNGETVEAGQTPVKALGATDQHSQIQLYVEGPNDKVITFMEVEHFANDSAIQNHFDDIPEFDYLSGKTMGQLLNAEKHATELALSNNQRPNLTIQFPVVDARHIGAFLFLLEAATALTGGLLNIDAFNQPGVEEGKIATYALMDRHGYEKKKSEIEALAAKKIFYII